MERCGFEKVFKGIAPYQGVDREVVKNVWRVWAAIPLDAGTYQVLSDGY